MSVSKSDNPVVFHSRIRRQCAELQLVLQSAEITSRLRMNHGRWEVAVAEKDESLALSELAAYRRDNPIAAKTPTTRLRLYGGAMTAVAVYCVVLFFLYFCSSSPQSSQQWRAIGQMDAELVLEGQIWRTITALTLHADLGHLISNLAYGSVFGLMAGRLLGGGIAWATILTAGAFGNGINAVARHGQHLSIGASTAVFAALGILVAQALRPTGEEPQPLLQRWKPLIVGIIMLSLTGLGGPQTDVLAHVAGFVSGVMLGWIVARLPSPWLASSTLQMTTGGIAILSVMAFWIIAAKV